MNLTKMTSTMVVLLLAAMISGPALARGGHRGGFHGGHHGGHVRLGVFIGAPALWYYGPPAYYYYPYPYPPVVEVPYSPPVYIERGDAQAAPEPSSQAYWYYCAEEKTYYPYIKQCPGGWQRVTPQPPPGG